MCVVLAKAKAGNGVSETKGGDTLKLGVREVEGAVLGRRAVDGTVPNAASGEETCLLVRWHVKPEGLGLEVIEYTREAALNGFYLKSKGLLKVEEWAWGLPCTWTSERIYPFVGGVQILKEVDCLLGVN